MSRTQLVWILLGLTVLLSGCALGAHPFDYCGPTYTCGPGGCSLCEPRAGSILSGPARMEPPPGVVQPVGTIDFGQDILSASDGNADGPLLDKPAAPGGETIVEGPAIGEEGTVVEGPDISAPAPAASAPAAPAPAASATPPKAAESAGWTAVRFREPDQPATTNR